MDQNQQPTIPTAAVPQSPQSRFKPKPRQRKAAVAVVENAKSDHPLPIGQVLKSVGYGTGLQTQPARVLESQGFKVALAEMGLTTELITESLVDDIHEKPGKRLGELRLGAEILKLTKPESDPNEKPKTGNTYNFIFNAENQKDINKLNDNIKSRIIDAATQTN